jgi:mono/diheme cytochrome c family protein
MPISLRPVKLISAVTLAVLLSSCAGLSSRSTPLEVWPDMKRQHKFRAQTANPNFDPKGPLSWAYTDGRTQHLPPEGTVAVGLLKEDDAFYRGQTGGMYVGRNPLTLDKTTFELGQKKFNTYCSPCHDRTGGGHGVVWKKMPTFAPANLHEDRVKGYPDGEYFDIVSNGRRNMKGYKNQITERDRWAIIAYIRVLQRQDGAPADVPAAQQADVR